jgi:hypothetical protein
VDDGAVGVWWGEDGVLDEPGEAVGAEPLEEARQVTRQIVRQHRRLPVAARTLPDTLGHASLKLVES